MNFIKLHDKYGTEIRVNFDLIDGYYSTYAGLTKLIPVSADGEDFPYIVKESPAFIDTKIAVMQHESKL